MITNRSLRFALCALLLLAPLATLAAQEMQDTMMGNDEGFYLTAAYAAAMPVMIDGSDEATTVSVGTDFAYLGGRFGVGYAVAGFRPEVSVGGRSATIDSLKVTKPGTLEIKPDGGTVTSIDLAANVYYDIDGGGSFSLYLGVGGGLSLITVTLPDTVPEPFKTTYSDSASALSFQAAAGIGYAVMEDLTLTLGYRLVGTMEAKFNKTDAKTKMMLGHNVELGLRFSF